MRIAIFLVLAFIPARAFSRAPEPLDAKLAKEWVRYARAQSAVIAGVVPRADWEKILGAGLAPADLATLIKRQDATVEASRLRYLQSSTLDLDKLRRLGEGKVREFCAAFPKGGMLHLHPFGTLSEPALTEILEKANPLIETDKLVEKFGAKDALAILYPPELAMLTEIGTRYGKQARYANLDKRDRERFRGLYFLGEGTHPFVRFEAIFKLMSLAVSNAAVDATGLMYEDFYARAQKEHVSYAEFSEVGDFDWLAKIEGWANDILNRFGVTERFTYAFIRTLPAEKLHDQANELLARPANPYLVGINVVANEDVAPALERAQTGYAPVLKAVKEGRSKLHIGCHAGELGDRRNPRDMLIMGAERLGHAVKLKEDRVALEYARQHATGIEANLTSNVRLGAVKSLAEHPFLYYLRLGLKVSLSTDDEGIFRTDINRECETAIGAFDTSYAELREIATNSLDTAFATPQTIAPLREKLDRDLKAFENQWKGAIGR